MKTPIQVLVVDDHAIVRQGICSLLAEIDDIQVVGEAEDGRQAVDQALNLQPEVILMDLVMPNMNGIEAMHHISQRLPSARFLVLSSYSGDDQVFPAIKAGAMGFLLKDSRPEELVKAIREVHQGQPSLHPSIVQKLMKDAGHREPPQTTSLTEREREVLVLLARGLENWQIAEELVITEVTVRSHISHILDKLHLENRVQATLYALREGLVAPEYVY